MTIDLRYIKNFDFSMFYYISHLYFHTHCSRLKANIAVTIGAHRHTKEHENKHELLIQKHKR